MQSITQTGLNALSWHIWFMSCVLSWQKLIGEYNMYNMSNLCQMKSQFDLISYFHISIWLSTCCWGQSKWLITATLCMCSLLSHGSSDYFANQMSSQKANVLLIAKMTVLVVAKKLSEIWIILSPQSLLSISSHNKYSDLSLKTQGQVKTCVGCPESIYFVCFLFLHAEL